MSKKARDKWQNSASFSRNGDLHVAKKTTNRPGFAHEPSRFGFLANVYCPRSPAGVSFPKLALFFVPGDQNAAARRLRVDDRRFANRPRAGQSRGNVLFGFAIQPFVIVVLDRSDRRLGCFSKPVRRTPTQIGDDRLRVGSGSVN